MAVTTWNIDPAHADMVFSAKPMIVTTVRGKFHDVSGTVSLDEEHPANSAGTFTVSVASLNTGVESRDAHLRSAGFFDAEDYPTATFTTTRIEGKGGSDYTVPGTSRSGRRRGRSPSTWSCWASTRAWMAPAARASTAPARSPARRRPWLERRARSGGWLVGKEVKRELDLAVQEAAAATADEVNLAA